MEVTEMSQHIRFNRDPDHGLPRRLLNRRHFFVMPKE
jgi:hypothetical protein